MYTLHNKNNMNKINPFTSSALFGS